MKKILLAGAVIIFLFNAGFAFALEPIVQCELGSSGNPCDLYELFAIISRLISLILYYIIPPLAVVAFLMAGIFFLFSAGDPAKVSKGKAIFRVTVFGILIAYSGWLIVNTIIHQLTGDKAWPWQKEWYQIPDRGKGEGAPERPTTPDKDKKATIGIPTGTYTDEEARFLLESHGISINKTNCADVYTSTNCTSLDGIPKSTINRLLYIKENCPECNVKVNGGTEVAPHKSHAPGKPIVDLGADYQTIEYLTKNRDAMGVAKVCTAPEDYNYRFRCDDDEEVRHFHVEFVN